MKSDDAVRPAHNARCDIDFFSLLQPLLAHGDFSIAAAEFTSRLAQYFRCDRVSLGFLDADAIKIAAISNHHQDIESAMLPDLQAVMEECILQDVLLIYPQPISDFPYIVLAHARFAQVNGASLVFSVPFGHAGRIVGALVFERRLGGGLDAGQAEALTVFARHASSLLEMKWLQEQPFATRCLRRLRDYWKGDGDETTARRRYGAGLISMALVAVFFLVPMSNEVTGQARLEAYTQRTISAPVDGYLKEVRVRPGDRVQQGQVLGELNDETLQTESRRLEAEAAQQENALAEAMAKADRAQVVIRRAKLDEVVAQRDLVAQQLDRIHLIAPFDGAVIKGDLSQLAGSPIKRGDALLTLSQGTGFRVIVQVSERDIPDIAVGQRGSLVFTALPAEKYPIRVVRLTPFASVSAEGQNVFEVEAALEQPAEKLVPGLQGAAKIVTGARPPGWKWTMRAWHALYFLAWSKLP